MDTLFTALRVAVSLALVIGLIWFVQRKSARWSRTKSTRPITVIAKQSLGGKSRVVIVEADGTQFVLGVTDASVVVLASRETRSFAEALAVEEGADQEGVDQEGADQEDAGQEDSLPVALLRPRNDAARRRRAARPSFSEAITSAETWKKAAQSLRGTR